MSDALDLITRAKQYVPADQAPAACWDLVVKGIEVGWLDHDELRELLEHLRDRRDFGVDEILFAHVGEELRVSFLDDRAVCSPDAVISALEAVLNAADA